MRIERRKFNIFEQMELAYADSTASGPVEEYILTPDDVENYDKMSVRKSFDTGLQN
jgi:hypothetical protein